MPDAITSGLVNPDRDPEAIVGVVYWREARPFHNDTYTGVTTDGKPCTIEMDWRTRVCVDGKPVNSDTVLYWHLRVRHVKSLIDGLEQT